MQISVWFQLHSNVKIICFSLYIANWMSSGFFLSVKQKKLGDVTLGYVAIVLGILQSSVAFCRLYCWS